MPREDTVTKALFSVLIPALLPVLLVATGVQEKPVVNEMLWQPDRPITLIVPWEAGGTSDRSARTTAGVLKEYLRQEIIVVNQPGGAGTLGIRSAMEAARDGYTWTAGSARDLGNYRIQGMLDTSIEEWHLFLNIAIPQVIAVPADSPYREFGSLLAAFKSRPGRITIATAGTDSPGHIAIEGIRKSTGIVYRHVGFDSGGPALIAAVRGETDVAAQLSVEVADMLRAGKLRALAVLSIDPLELTGYGIIPPITKWIPGFKPAMIYFGIFVPEGVPPGVIETLGALWDAQVKESAVLKQFAAENGLIFNPAWGDRARELCYPMIQLDAWLKYDAGQAVISPDTIGISRPEQH